MHNGMQNDAPGHSRETFLFCGDDGWLWVKKDEFDPRYPNTGMRIRHTFLGEPGAWCFLDKICMLNQVQTETDKDFCDSDTLALTDAKLGFITVCPRLFNKIKKKIDSTIIQRGTRLDSRKLEVYSHTLVHEL